MQGIGVVRSPASPPDLYRRCVGRLKSPLDFAAVTGQPLSPVTLCLTGLTFTAAVSFASAD